MADTRGLLALPHISLVLPRFPKKLGIKNPSTSKPVAQSASSIDLESFGAGLSVAPRCASFAAPTPLPFYAEEDFVGVFALPSGHFDKLVEQPAPSLAARHPRVSPAHLHRVFLYALFTHGHGWLHGVPICEATGLPFPIPEISSVSASMRQHGQK